MGGMLELGLGALRDWQLYAGNESKGIDGEGGGGGADTKLADSGRRKEA